LNNGVASEMTVTQHTVLHRLTYSNATAQILLLDLTTDLSRSFQGNGDVNVAKTAAGTRITGGGEFLPSFGEGNYKVFFCFDAPAFTEAVFYQPSPLTSVSFQTINGTAFNSTVTQAGSGVIMKFAPPANGVLNVRVGISWTSAAKACSFAQAEIPNLGAFDAVKAAARLVFTFCFGIKLKPNLSRAKWNDVLGTIAINTNGVASDVQEIFWSSLYRAHISPTNITGDNPLWVSNEPFYDSFYCIWYVSILQLYPKILIPP